jgi:phospholipase C
MRRARVRATCALVILLAACGGGAPSTPTATRPGVNTATAVPTTTATTTPIHYLVVIYQENATFDHYFGTYPHAVNPPGEPAFTPAPGTPAVNGLTPDLLTHNPNIANPHRLGRDEAITCDNDHSYKAEQVAFDGGKMDKFVETTGRAQRTAQCTGKPLSDTPDYNVMDYYDGNTVTALWNYAQHFALSDNSYDTTFGPSTPGHINLISGNTHGFTASGPGGQPASADVPGYAANGTLIGNLDPAFDDCAASNARPRVAFTGRNIGDLLNTKAITWGWFSGGFTPTRRQADGMPVCASAHPNIAGQPIPDYGAVVEPFQYYRSTANPQHLPPNSPAQIGQTDQANHQYDLTDFWQALAAHHLPAVSFLKAAGYQQGHPQTSDPLDEQRFLVETINQLMQAPEWREMAVVIAWDDSDGWYDHQLPPIVTPSNDPQYDALNGPGQCGDTPPAPGAYLDRCGYGPRQPLLVISPYAKANFVDHTLTDQTSILRFIEDNWDVGRIGDQSFDARAGTLANMFDFAAGPRNAALPLDEATGVPATR